jgi:hypothetical protein
LIGRKISDIDAGRRKRQQLWWRGCKAPNHQSLVGRPAPKITGWGPPVCFRRWLHGAPLTLSLTSMALQRSYFANLLAGNFDGGSAETEP